MSEALEQLTTWLDEFERMRLDGSFLDGQGGDNPLNQLGGLIGVLLSGQRTIGYALQEVLERLEASDQTPPPEERRRWVL